MGGVGPALPERREVEKSFSESLRKKHILGMSKSPRPKYMTTQEAADYLGISKSWLAHARLRGEGPTYIPIPAGQRPMIKYDPADLDKWMHSLKMPMGEPIVPPESAFAATKRKRGRPTKAETVARRSYASQQPSLAAHSAN